MSETMSDDKPKPARDAGLAPIKAEFLVPKRAPAPAPAPTPTPAAAPAEAEVGMKRSAPDDTPVDEVPPPQDESASGAGSSQPKQRQRGMNKNRKPWKVEKEEIKMCAAVVRGDECKFGDSCRFSHDLVAAMARRPADLPGELCPIYTLRGHCKFGINCRFGLGHLDAATGVNLRKAVEESPYEEINVVNMDLTQQLRKNKVDFKAVDALADKFAKMVQAAHDLHQTGMPSDKAAAEVAAADAAASGSGAAAAESAAAATRGGADGEAEVAAYHERAAIDGGAPLHERKLVDFRGKLLTLLLTSLGLIPCAPF